MKELKKVTT